MLPAPAVPGCCLVYFHFLCYILCSHSVDGEMILAMRFVCRFVVTWSNALRNKTVAVCFVVWCVRCIAPSVLLQLFRRGTGSPSPTRSSISGGVRWMLWSLTFSDTISKWTPIQLQLFNNLLLFTFRNVYDCRFFTSVKDTKSMGHVWPSSPHDHWITGYWGQRSMVTL